MKAAARTGPPCPGICNFFSAVLASHKQTVLSYEQLRIKPPWTSTPDTQSSWLTLSWGSGAPFCSRYRISRTCSFVMSSLSAKKMVKLFYFIKSDFRSEFRLPLINSPSVDLNKSSDRKKSNSGTVSTLSKRRLFNNWFSFSGFTFSGTDRVESGTANDSCVVLSFTCNCFSSSAFDVDGTESMISHFFPTHVNCFYFCFD